MKRTSDSFEKPPNRQFDQTSLYLPCELWIYILGTVLNAAWDNNQLQQLQYCQRVSRQWHLWITQSAPTHLHYLQWNVMVSLMSSQQQQQHQIEPISCFPSLRCLSYAPALEETALAARTSLVTQFLYQLTGLTALCLTLDRQQHYAIDVPDLRRLTNLRALSLSNNTLITAPSLAPLAHTLTELDLSGSIPLLGWQALRGFTALQSLSMIRNYVFNTRMFKTFSSLTRLDLRGHRCCRHPNQGNYVFNKLALHTNLTALTIHANDFDCLLRIQTPQELIAERLPSVTSLTVLDHYRSAPFPLLIGGGGGGPACCGQ